MVRSENGEVVHRLVNLRKPVLRIPTLAIHLDRQEKFEFRFYNHSTTSNDSLLYYSKEAHLFPIAGLAAAELQRQGISTQTPASGEQSSQQEEDVESNFEPMKPLRDRHHPRLVSEISYFWLFN